MQAQDEPLTYRVQIWQNGRKLPLPQLFLYEACQACAEMPRADVSVGTYVAATGDDACQRGTAGGFDVLVLEKRVRVSAAARAAGVGGVGVGVGVLAALFVALG
jgi:hypothetical protein